MRRSLRGRGREDQGVDQITLVSGEDSLNDRGLPFLSAGGFDSILAMSAGRMKKFGPQVQSHLDVGERLIDVIFAIALKTAPKGVGQQNEGPIIGTGAKTSSQLLKDMPSRTPGVVCVTDFRVLFFGTGFSKVKRLWWEVPRDRVAGIEPGSPLFAVRFADTSAVWFGGGRNDYEAIAAALGLPI